MTTLSSKSIESMTIDMERDEVRVIESRGGSLSQLKKAISAMRKLTDKMSVQKDISKSVRVSRENRGR